MYKDYLKLHFIIILWGFTAITGKWISIDASVLVWYRTLLAAFGVGLLLYFKGINIAIDKIAMLKMLATGGLVAAHWFCFFEAARISTVSALPAM